MLILGYFKYTDFAISIINSISGKEVISLKNIVLPIGISFYTFQALSYVIDVYREHNKAQKNVFNLTLYISFFPQLIAGPIVKYHDIENQIINRNESLENISYGIKRFIYGLSKKVILANMFALSCDEILKQPVSELSTVLVWLAAVLYTLQIYYDFSGYSDMVIGLGHMFGFKFLENFNYPYISKSVQEFWRRWHISLSTWLRDYVYLPIIFSGKKLSNLRNYFAIMVTFFISGLWHGANWTYVVWGLYHGFCIVMAEMTNPYKKKLYKKMKVNTKCFSFRLSAMIVTFILVNIGYLIFRAPDFHTAYEMWKQMFSVWNPWIFFDNSLYDMGLDRKDFWVLCFSVMVLWIVSFMQERGIKIRQELAKQNLVFRWIIYYTVIIFILVFGIYGEGYDASQFIYFQF